MKGFRIGSNVKIGLGSIIIAKDVVIGNNVQIGLLNVIRARHIEIGDYTTIASLCYVDTEYLKIGKDTRIREQVSVGGIKTQNSKLIVGDRCLINHFAFLNPSMPIIIGNDTAIGGRSLIFTHSSWLSQLEGYPVKLCPIKIGNYVWISWQTTITAGVEIGDYVVVQPNVVVSKNIPSNSIFTGLQNKIIPGPFYPKVEEEEKKKIIKQIVHNFIEYMEYHGVKVNIKNDSAFFSINNKYYRLIVQEDENIELLSNYYNVLLNIKYSNYLTRIINKKDMVLSFEDKTRRGSNLLGEELVKYFSRSGIRFSRIN